MIRDIVLPIDFEFIAKPVPSKEGTGVIVPMYFSGYGEVYRKTIRYVPDYEETNKRFAKKIYETIMKNAKELGEIKEIFMTPCPYPGKYQLYIKGNVIEKSEIEVPEHYGETYE